MSCDYMSHIVSIGIFYSGVHSIVRKKMFFMTKFKPFCYNLNLLFHTFCNLVVHIVMNYLIKSFYANLSFTLILLILIRALPLCGGHPIYSDHSVRPCIRYKSCPGFKNFFVLQDRLCIYGMQVDNLQTMCRVPLLVTFDLEVKRPCVHNKSCSGCNFLSFKTGFSYMACRQTTSRRCVTYLEF